MPITFDLGHSMYIQKTKLFIYVDFKIDFQHSFKYTA